MRVLQVIPLAWILTLLGIVSDLYYREGIDAILAPFCFIPFLLPLLLMGLPIRERSRISLHQGIGADPIRKLNDLYFIRTVALLLIWLAISIILMYIAAAMGG